jgi:excisionase family DNA binding protein
MNTAERSTRNLSELEAEKQGLWNAKDVAEYLKVSRSWVYHQAEAALLPCLRIGSLLRFESETIRRFARGEWKPADPAEAPKKKA